MTRKSIGIQLFALIVALAMLPIACKDDTAREAATGSMMGLQRAGTEYSELAYPLPPVPPGKGGKLPPPDGHNVVWYRGGNIVGSPGRISGMVRQHTAGKLEIDTKAGPLLLEYAIPGLKMLPMKTGEKVSFDFTRGNALHPADFFIADSVGSSLCHASCRVTGDSELIVPLTLGVTIYQMPGGLPVSVGGYQIRDMPVKLKYQEREIVLRKKEPVTIQLSGRNYSVMLVNSFEQRPTAGNTKYSEWEGYSLECVVIPSDGIL